MLFLLFIRDIFHSWRKESGWRIGEEWLPGLLFADDIALIAESEDELSDMIKSLQIDLEEKELEMNTEKTLIMTSGAPKGEERVWKKGSGDGSKQIEMKKQQHTSNWE